MTDPLARIEPTEGLPYALDGVRLAHIAVANRAKAKENLLRIATPLTLAAGVWWMFVLFAAWAIPEPYSFLAAYAVLGGKWMSLTGVSLVTIAAVFPSALSDTPRAKWSTGASDKGTLLFDVILCGCVIAFLPLVAGLALTNILSTMRDDPRVKVTDGRRGDGPTANEILADDRVRKLYGDLVREIDAWNEAIIPVNRLIFLANAEECGLTETEQTLIAEHRVEQARLERRTKLAQDLLSEGVLGSRPAITDVTDPLTRLSDGATENQRRTSALAEDAQRLLAAREVNAALSRT